MVVSAARPRIPRTALALAGLLGLSFGSCANVDPAELAEADVGSTGASPLAPHPSEGARAFAGQAPTSSRGDARVGPASDPAVAAVSDAAAAEAKSLGIHLSPPLGQPEPGYVDDVPKRLAAPLGWSIDRPSLPAGPRIYAKARFVWIHPAPEPGDAWIGYLAIGGSAPLRGATPEAARVKAPGCEAWYAIEPRGYVCAGPNATVDPQDPEFQALLVDAGDTRSPWPFEYAESLGAPRYPSPPDEETQRAKEWYLDDHLDNVRRARSAQGPDGVAAIDPELVGVPLERTGFAPPALLDVTPYVREERPLIAKGSTVAYTRSFDLGERPFVLTADHTLVPRDRLRPYPRSYFHGVELTDELTLPLGFARKQDRPLYRKEGDEMAPSGRILPRLAWMALTGVREVIGDDTYWETRTPGYFVREGEVSVASEALQMPVEGPNEPPPTTWVDVSVKAGILVAYERSKPVFATLISPGRGGIPVKGVDPLKTASTPTGTFRVDGKFLSATMVSSTNDLLVHTEVQYVQNFHGPHALHGAYWHDVWGEPKSGGCVNLSPRDSQWIFHWSEPRLPAGWHGMRGLPIFGNSTVVVIHE